MIDKLIKDVIDAINVIVLIDTSEDLEADQNKIKLSDEGVKIVTDIIKKLAADDLLAQEHFNEPAILVQMILSIYGNDFLSKYIKYRNLR